MHTRKGRLALFSRDKTMVKVLMTVEWKLKVGAICHKSSTFNYYESVSSHGLPTIATILFTSIYTEL